MNESTTWLQQARADRQTGESLFGLGAGGRCHVIAKYQQCAEKAIKGLVVALRDAGVLQSEPGRGHGVARFIKVLLRLPHVADNRVPQQHLRGLFNQTVRDSITALDALAPRWPLPGQPPRRNTEYPFVDDVGGWTFPAAAGIFSEREADRFRQLTHVILAGVGRVIAAIRRRPK